MTWPLTIGAGRAPSLGALIAFVLARSMSVIYPPAPGFPMDLAAIHLFGWAAGLALAECGIMLGATVAFVVARAASPELAERLGAKWKLVQYVEGRFPDAGTSAMQQFSAWFWIRLFTNPLFDPLSYIAGLTSVSFWPYFFGTLLGNLPSTFVFFAIESHAAGGELLGQAIIALAFCAAVIYVANLFLGPTQD